MFRNGKVIKIFLFLSVFMLVFSGQVIAGAINNYPAIQQEKSNWCWAGVGSSILKSKGNSVSQCSFYKTTKGTSSCSNQTASTLEVQSGLMNYGVYSTYYTDHLSWSSLIDQIDGNNPVYVSWKWASGGGHAVVAYGYYSSMSTNYVRYMDPLYGVKTSMKYSKFIGGSTSDRDWRWGLKNI